MCTNIIKKLVIFCIIIFSLLNLCSCRIHELGKLDIHIFSIIEECENIKEAKTDDAKITIYDSPKKDKNLRKFEYEEFFGCNYKSKDFSFELFAYEFVSSDIAMAYFENETGKDSDPNPTFSDRGGMTSYRRIVVSDNRAYILKCKVSEKDKVIEFINSIFSMEITYENHKPVEVKAEHS